MSASSGRGPGMTQHPARSRSGFAGLRLVSDPRPEDEPEPVFTVQVTIESRRASIAWDPKTPDVARPLSDLIDAIGQAVFALRTEQDVADRVQRSYEMRQRWRLNMEERRVEHERTHPWLCDCGRRCKSETGLKAHQRAGSPSCG